MSNDLLVDIKDGVATLTFNRPDARNALSVELREAIAQALGDVEFDDAVRCVVMQGAGGNFMAGGDVKGQMERQKLPPAERRAMSQRNLHSLHYAIMKMRHMRKPVLASVQGAVAGAGVGLMAAADLVVAADNAFFFVAHVHVGLSIDGSTSYFLPRIVGQKRAAELAMLGDRIDAQTALDWGLINRVVPLAEHEAEVAKLAARLAKAPTGAIGRSKALIEASPGNTLETQLQMEATFIGESVLTEDHAEGAKAFIEKRKPAFKGR